MGGRSCTAFLLANALAGLCAPVAALAVTLNVNSTADTLVAGDRHCTLREAIINANRNADTTAGDCAAGSGTDLINVPAGIYVLGIAGTNEDAAARGDLDITEDLTLRGADPATTVINAAGLDRVLDIRVTGVASVERMTLTGGITTVLNGFFLGSAISVTGNPAARSYLDVSEVHVWGNQGACGLNPSGLPDCSGTVSGDSGTLTLRRSALTDNSGGGGVYWGGDAFIENSVISGNTSTPVHVFGAECDYWFKFPAAILVANALRLGNSTIARNTIPPDPTPAACWSGQRAAIGYYNPFFPLSLEARATILANPGLANCSDRTGLSTGYNIDSDGTCGFTRSTDLSNVHPRLGPLQNNGGPTPTHALLRGSPAIDRIPTSACILDDDGDPLTPGVALTKDQRGGTRPREGDGTAPTGCDIGSYEVAACADGLDNDGDGLIDFDGGATAGLTPLASFDPNCGSALGNTEAGQAGVGCGIGPELALLIPALVALRYRRRESRTLH